MILEGFRDQIPIPGEISCPGMVSDPRNLNFLLRPEISLWMNFFIENITLIQILQARILGRVPFPEART